MVLVFDDGALRGHVIAVRFLSDLDSLCRRDYGTECFHKSIACLDMDAYEDSLSGDNDATMDASVGIASYDNNREFDRRHLLVELRFNYQSVNNFNIGNMRRKVAHTKDLLIGDCIHDEMVFIYKEAVAPKAQSYFNRWSKQYHEVSFWKAMSVAEF